MTNLDKIKKIEDEIRQLTKRADLGVFNQSVYEKIEQLEFELQELRGYESDSTRHSRKNYYRFKCSWVGRKFKCIKTGEELIIPETVTYGSFFEFGECFLDVGDGHYCRGAGDIEEIKVDYREL